MEQPDRSVLSVDQDDMYVITGGTGGIGRALIKWLIEAQKVPAQQLLVLCRSSTSVGAQALVAQGVKVASVDVSKPQSIVDSPELAALDKVTGIFHLAGVLDDGLISNMSRERVATVMAPKTSGLDGLMEQGRTKSWDLEFVVAFSSTSSLFGYPGQSNYCGANAYLDQLASWGTAAVDQPTVLAMNWGPWGEAGMAAAGTKAHEQALRDGDIPLRSRDALAALTTALASRFEVPQTTREFAVCNVRWSTSQWKDLPIIETVLASEEIQRRDAIMAATKVGKVTTTSAQLMAKIDLAIGTNGGDVNGNKSNASDASGPVDAILREMVPRWDLSQSLAALGMDSLDLVQLRNTANRRLGMKAPLSTYMKPNRTLQELRVELESMLANSM
jgi:nucleoside-diphosphate-sugar epimerase